MKNLSAADSADAIVDGLRRRRAEVYVPSSRRPLSVPDLALPRRIKRIVQRTFRSDQIAHEFDPAARADYQEATRRPLPELVTEALTNDEPAERRVISLATANTHASAASMSNSTRPARRHHLRERTRQVATRSARTTNALLPTDAKASVRANVHQTPKMDDEQERTSILLLLDG